MLEARRYNAINAVAKELAKERFDDVMNGGHGYAVTIDPSRVIQTIFGGNLKTIETTLQVKTEVAEKELWKRDKK